MPKCKECKSFQGRCDSCFIIDGTEKIKEVTFCSDCNAYICNDCRDSWTRRGLSYFALKLGLADRVEQTEETIIEKEKLYETPKENVIIVNEAGPATEPIEETKGESIDFQADEPFSETIV